MNASIPMSTRSLQRNMPAESFVDRLSQPRAGYASNAIAAVAQSLVSFGLLPLILWPVWWSAFVDKERADLLDVSAWWRQRVPPNDSKKLDGIASQFRPRPILMVLPWLAAGFNAGVMGLLFMQGDTLNRLWDLTFRFDRHWDVHRPLEMHLHSAWIAGLCFGFGCQWYAVRSHARAVHALVKWINRLGKTNQGASIRSDALQLGLHPLWIGAAILLCGMQAWWGIPMVMAGAMQRRYSIESSGSIRIALAGQAQGAAAVNQPYGARFCSMENCGGRVPDIARFCPRCGASVAGNFLQ